MDRFTFTYLSHNKGKSLKCQQNFLSYNPFHIEQSSYLFVESKWVQKLCFYLLSDIFDLFYDISLKI